MMAAGSLTRIASHRQRQQNFHVQTEKLCSERFAGLPMRIQVRFLTEQMGKLYYL